MFWLVYLYTYNQPCLHVHSVNDQLNRPVCACARGRVSVYTCASNEIRHLCVCALVRVFLRPTEVILLANETFNEVLTVGALRACVCVCSRIE